MRAPLSLIATRMRPALMAAALLALAAPGAALAQIEAQAQTNPNPLAPPSGLAPPDALGGPKPAAAPAGPPPITGEGPLDLSDISLFYTPQQLSLLNQALNSPATFVPQDDPNAKASDTPGGKPVGRPPLVLTGLIFKSAKDWTIFLNGRAYRPNSLPAQLQEIEVTQEHVSMVWLENPDDGPINLRLRPRQKYDFAAKTISDNLWNTPGEPFMTFGDAVRVGRR